MPARDLTDRIDVLFTLALDGRRTEGLDQYMRALQLHGDRDLRLVEMDDPADPAPGEVQISVSHVALNHIDVWGFRGMAFAKRQMPLVVGAEGAGTVTGIGEGVTNLKRGDKVTMYGALTCGECRNCKAGIDNLCEEVKGVYGFHIHGFAREKLNMPARLVVKVPDSVPLQDAACAGIAFGTTQHMLFDNAKLQPGETVLVHAGGSGIGTVAIKMAKAIGCTVITTVGDDEKGAKAKTLGADHVINYRTERFEGEVRQWTKRNSPRIGVDVVFEHVGADTWNGSLLSMKKGGRLVTCGSTSGVSVTMNLMQLFQQQYRIFGSFGCRIENIGQSLDKMVAGITPVIDTIFPVADLEQGIARLESRKVFGKILVAF